jgi:CBS domain-containing protein
MGERRMKASEVMTEEVVTIRSSATITQATKLMKEKNVSALIVNPSYNEDAYGIITETDIVQKVVAFGKNPEQVRVYEVMSKPCLVVNPELAVEYVARLFTTYGIRRAPIIKDKLLGIISVTDILTKSNFIEQPREILLEEKIKAAIEQARELCKQEGVTARNCAAAWHIVEELQAEAAYQRAEKLPKTAFEEYQEENPELLYDAWCSG